MFNEVTSIIHLFIVLPFCSLHIMVSKVKRHVVKSFMCHVKRIGLFILPNITRLNVTDMDGAFARSAWLKQFNIFLVAFGFDEDRDKII